MQQQRRSRIPSPGKVISLARAREAPQRQAKPEPLTGTARGQPFDPCLLQDDHRGGYLVGGAGRCLYLQVDGSAVGGKAPFSTTHFLKGCISGGGVVMRISVQPGLILVPVRFE